MDTVEELLTTHLTQAADAAELTPPDIDDIVAAVDQHRRRRRIRTGLLVAAACLAAAGTVSVLTTDNRSRTDIVDNPSTTTTEADPTTTTSTTSTTTTTAPPPVDEAAGPPADPRSLPTSADLALAGGGLNAKGTIFGTQAQSLLDMVVWSFGPPDSDTGGVLGDPCSPGDIPCLPLDSAECPDAAGQYWRTVRWDGLSLYFLGTSADDTVFVGWRATSSPVTADLTTSEGVGLDEPLSAWQEVYGPALTVGPSPSSLIVTTEHGTMRASSRNDAMVVLLAGLSCADVGD